MEKIAVPLIIGMSLTVLEYALYAIESALLWFLLSYILPSLIYFAILFNAFYKRRTRFLNDKGKLKDSFYVLKTVYAFIVWVTAIGSLAAGDRSYLPVLISLSFTALPPYMAVLSIEMLLRKPKASCSGIVAELRDSKLRGSTLRRMRSRTAICIWAAIASVAAIGSQFRSMAELPRYVPDHPAAWVGWISFLFVGFFMRMAARPDVNARWLAVLFVYLWIFYGHYSLNVNYSMSPSRQVLTLAAILPIYGVILFVSLWRSRTSLLDADGSVTDWFEYLKSLVLGIGWVLATVVVLVLNRMHQSTLPVAVWGGIPISVAIVLIVIFGYESYFRWKSVSRSLPGPEQASAARSGSSHFWRRSAPLVLIVVFPPVTLYVLAMGIGAPRTSPVVLGLVLLPFFIALHMFIIWKRRKELLLENGRIGEGFQYYKAATACATWLLGTLALILLKVWLISGGHSSAFLVTVIPFTIAPLVSGLYVMETWFRAMSGKS